VNTVIPTEARNLARTAAGRAGLKQRPSLLPVRSPDQER